MRIEIGLPRVELPAFDRKWLVRMLVRIEPGVNQRQETAMNVDQTTLKELRAIRGLLEGIAKRLGVPEPVAPVKKPWSGSHAVSVRKVFGHPVEAGSVDVPSALTPEMRRAAEEQKKTPGNPKSVATFKADEPEPIRLSDENLRRGGWR